MSLSTPAAIVVGLALAGALAGAGLYFGMRARPAVTVSAPESASARVAGPVRDRGAGEGTPAETAAADRLHASDEIGQAFESQRARFVHDCWEPSAAKSPMPPSVTITFMLTFGADGRQRTRSLREDPTRARPDVTACVQKELGQLSITPPGAQSSATYALTLP